MIKKNMPGIILSTLVTLLPAVTGTMLPVFFAIGNLLCLLITMKDPGNREQNKKAMRMMYFICPVLSIYCTALNYAVKTGMEFGIDVTTTMFIGAVFVIIGNYLPKCKQNTTIGIKVPWVYTSQENWTKTHRFGGKVWAAGGFLLMFAVFLPERIKGTVLVGSIFLLVIIPALYSYLYYRRERKEGKEVSVSAVFARSGKVSFVILAIIFFFVGITLFTGNIEFSLRDDSVLIEADYWEDTTVFFDRIEKIEYRENGVSGTRTGGFGSPRLLMGTFENDEFGYYTRYTYTRCDSAIVIFTKKNEIVISAKTEEETKALYDALKMHVK